MDRETSEERDRCPPWMRQILRAAGVYNLLWGALVISWPGIWMEWLSMQPPRYPQIWQCLGMIVGVYGIAYWIAARNPFHHWPIVLLGLLGKLLAPLGFAAVAIQADLPWTLGATILTSDLIWWAPFGLILYQAFHHHSDTTQQRRTSLDLNSALHSIRSHRGVTLARLSAQQRVMVVFLRHTGCTFCRATLADLAVKRAYIESRGITLALVHMSAPLQATQLLQKYDLDDIHRFSDPHCLLYEVFGLWRGTFRQLFSWKVLWRGLKVALVQNHGFGPISGDGFRMAGLFILRNSRIIAAYRAQTAADSPNLAQIAKRAVTADTYRLWPEMRSIAG